MAEYMILMRENDRAWSRFPPEEQQRLLQQYYDWVGELRAKDVFRDGNPLGYSGSRLLRAVDGEIVDGPFAETKEVLTGYFLIEAEDLEAALAIARGCPALGHGEVVELRPVGHG